MPIEIKELHLRVEVNSGTDKTTASPTLSRGTQKPEDYNEIVAECVEQVLEILQNKRER